MVVATVRQVTGSDDAECVVTLPENAFLPGNNADKLVLLFLSQLICKSVTSI
jgi:hypothetical protein